MRHFCYICMLLLLLVGCTGKSKSDKPAKLLSESEMVDVMTDVQIIEADMNVRKGEGKCIDGMAESYYDQLFSHYGINDSIFDENLRYYTQHPDVIERIMDSVTKRLEKEITPQAAK